MRSKISKWISASHEGLMPMAVVVHWKQLESRENKWNTSFQTSSRRKNSTVISERRNTGDMALKFDLDYWLEVISGLQCKERNQHKAQLNLKQRLKFWAAEWPEFETLKDIGGKWKKGEEDSEGKWEIKQERISSKYGKYINNIEYFS